jgi:hypothetical protein
MDTTISLFCTYALWHSGVRYKEERSAGVRPLGVKDDAWPFTPSFAGNNFGVHHNEQLLLTSSLTSY